MPFLFKIVNINKEATTVYSIHCENNQHQVHCEGGIYNMIAKHDHHYRFTLEESVPDWLKEKEDEINRKIREYYERHMP